MEERSSPADAVAVPSVLRFSPEPPSRPRMEERSMPADAVAVPSVLRFSPEPPSRPRIEERLRPLEAVAVFPSTVSDVPEPPSIPRIEESREPGSETVPPSTFGRTLVRLSRNERSSQEAESPLPRLETPL